MLGLGQSPVPTTSTCDSGQTSVQIMDSVFQSLPMNLQADFQSSHDAIMTRYNNTWYWGIDWIPFNPACGTMYDIGKSADIVTTQMQNAIGQVPLGTGPATGSNTPFLPSLLGSDNTALLIVGGLVLVFIVFKK